MDELQFNLNFGEALREIKQGRAVARKGWNGKNMYVYLNKGSFDDSKTRAEYNIEGINPDLFDRSGGNTVTRLPNINMMAATGSIVTGWLASQTDLLAEDWGVLALLEEAI